MTLVKSNTTVLISSLVEPRPTSTASLQSDSHFLFQREHHAVKLVGIYVRGFQTRALHAPASLITYALQMRSAFAVKACVCHRGHRHQGSGCTVQ